MRSIEIKVKTGDKTLGINGTELKLDESFFEAEASNVKDKQEKYLMLKYKNADLEFATDEQIKIYDFIEKQRLRKDIQTHNDTGEGDPTTISLTGNFKAYIFK